MLTAKQAKFLACYTLTLDATKSAIEAGYSAKSAHVEANRMLKNPKIIAELDSYKLKKRANMITKPDYIDTVWNEYETSEEKADRFRGLDLAGRALGFIGVNQDKPNQTLNVQINLNGNESPSELWKIARNIIGNE